MTSKIQELLDTVPERYHGPGGAAAVLKDGQVIAQTVWGFADMERRIPMTPDTLTPICSTTKQMVCQLLVDLERNPPPSLAGQDVKQKMANELERMVQPEIGRRSGLTIAHLCNMQSGLRDYWAMTTLWGAHPEGKFTVTEDGKKALERTKSFHFTPGTEFSYSNINFHIVGQVIERVTGSSLKDLLGERVFRPAGMKTAFLCADTARHPPPCVGYDGDQQHGFQPARNNIEWSGDAGTVASLADMVSYEQYVDRSWSDKQSLYRTIAEPQTYTDGTPAHYGNGLARAEIEGIGTEGHGGALRGFRCHRRHVPDERLSVVVMYNHETEAEIAAHYVLEEILKLTKPVNEAASAAAEPSTKWFGNFLDHETQLIINVSKTGKDTLGISYAGSVEEVKLVDADHAKSIEMIAAIDGDMLRIRRLADNRTLLAQRVAEGKAGARYDGYTGTYECPEIDSVFYCTGKGRMLYGAFSGFLGDGPVLLMRHIGEDVWVLECPRGMDAPAPGDWTVVFRRDGHGTVFSVTVGCWLARKLEYGRSS